VVGRDDGEEEEEGTTFVTLDENKKDETNRRTHSPGQCVCVCVWILEYFLLEELAVRCLDA